MATPVNLYKTPQRTPCLEFKTPICPPSTSTPFNYSNLSYSSFVRKNQSFVSERKDEEQITQSTDRFILNRRLFDPELSNFILTNRRKLQFDESKENVNENVGTQNETSPPHFVEFSQRHEYYAWSEKPCRRVNYRKKVLNLMTETNISFPRVLNFSSAKKQKPPPKPVPTTSSPQSKRHIPRFPEKILDMPQTSHKYGSNIMDWSEKTQEMVVGLDKAVFLWHPIKKNCRKIPLKPSTSSSCYFKADTEVTALSFDLEGENIIIALKLGSMILYNLPSKSSHVLPHVACGCLRPSTHLSAFAWVSLTDPSTLQKNIYGGKSCGCLFKMDVQLSSFRKFYKSFVVERQIDTPFKRSICNIKVASNQALLAVLFSNGNLSVIESCSGKVLENLKVHDGYALSLAWCPWEVETMATAGVVDGLLKIWRRKKYKRLEKVIEKTNKDSITCLAWAQKHKELVTGHTVDDGNLEDNNFVQIWQYPTMTLVCRLMGHKEKMLYAGVGLHNSMLATLGSDETMLLWRCFDFFVFKNNEWVLEPFEEVSNEKLIKDSFPCFSPMNRFNIR